MSLITCSLYSVSNVLIFKGLHKLYVEENLLHRDISIGNVLWLEAPRLTKPVGESLRDRSSPSHYRRLLDELVKECKISNLCTGFVIDGDMAIKFKPYFDIKDHRGSRSVS